MISPSLLIKIKNNIFKKRLISKEDLKKFFLFLLTLVVIALIDFCFSQNISIFNVKPNLTLCFVVFVGLNESFALALAIAFFAGLMKDSFSILVFGNNIATFVLIVFSAKEAKKRIFTQGVLVLSVIAFCGTWLSYFMLKFYSLIFNLNSITKYSIFNIAVESLLNAAIIFLIFKLLKKCAFVRFISLS
jgi:rod shape-determining protein MreD